MKLSDKLVKKDEQGNVILKDGKPIKISPEEYCKQPSVKKSFEETLRKYVKNFVEQANKEYDFALTDFKKNKNEYIEKLKSKLNKNNGFASLGEIDCFDQHGDYYHTMGLFIGSLFGRKIAKEIEPFKTDDDVKKFKSLDGNVLNFNFVENAALIKFYDKTILIQDIYGQGEQFYKLIELKDFPDNVDDLAQLEDQDFIKRDLEKEKDE